MKIDKSKIRFRKLGIEDIDLLIEYRIIFLKEIQIPKNKGDEIKLEQGLETYFSESFRNKSFIAYVAEYQHKPIAFAAMVIQNIPGHFNLISGKQGYILNMYTLPEARGLGICTKLLNILIEEGKELKLGKIALHATENGINIYRKRGFKEPDWTYLELKLN